MNTTVDLSTINDPITLKAMGYDALVEKEKADYNFSLINNRLKDVLAKPIEAKIVDPPSEPTPEA